MNFKALHNFQSRYKERVYFQYQIHLIDVTVVAKFSLLKPFRMNDYALIRDLDRFSLHSATAWRIIIDAN